MKNRLQEIIKYKTGGNRNSFAELMGWSPQYLAKLLRGESLGLMPVLTLLERMPEINARWFLLGNGDMLEIGKLYHLQREVFSHAQAVLDMEKYVPVMTPEEIHIFEQALMGGSLPVYDAPTLKSMQERLAQRQSEIGERVSKAIAKSNELCRQRTAKK